MVTTLKKVIVSVKPVVVKILRGNVKQGGGIKMVRVDTLSLSQDVIRRVYNLAVKGPFRVK